MKKTWTSIRAGLLAAAILAAGHSTAQPPALATEPSPPRTYVVIVDPGHGGVDGGTSHGGVLEKDIVLDIALRTRDILQSRGFRPVLTRDRDVDLSARYPSARGGRHARDLANRVRVAKESGASLFVSIHVNHSSSATRRGAVVLHAPDDVNGRLLAFLAAAALDPVTGRSTAAVPDRPLYVLRQAPCPSVLVEVGFLSNPSERAALLDPEHRQRLALALCRAVEAYWILAPLPEARNKKTPSPIEAGDDVSLWWA
ncbi:MAG: N-acetylmuramoyl-L-alanine amidase [Alicyclobacillaceae bacterium]|nr:N-acetylmuramoyl-L-alanine amidase [Alicyclobacillaceae bacterium]